MIRGLKMTDKNYDKKQKKEDEGKKEVDDKWGGLPGCVDLFILPIQIFIAGYSLFNII